MKITNISLKVILTRVLRKNDKVNNIVTRILAQYIKIFKLFGRTMINVRILTLSLMCEFSVNNI